MRANKWFSLLGVLIGSYVAPVFCTAAPCAGTNVNYTVTWEPTEISKGSTLGNWRARSVIVSNDPNAAFHLASGECKATFVTSSDGKTRFAGSCARRDKEGDVLFEDFEGDLGKGASRFVGGTGKFAKTESKMQWTSVPLQGGLGAAPWSGDCR